MTTPVIKQLSFRSAFLAKLNLIVRATGSKRKAAKAIGMDARLLWYWFARNQRAPRTNRLADKVDAAYEIAWARLHARRAVRRARYERDKNKTIATGLPQPAILPTDFGSLAVFPDRK